MTQGIPASTNCFGLFIISIGLNETSETRAPNLASESPRILWVQVLRGHSNVLPHAGLDGQQVDGRGCDYDLCSDQVHKLKWNILLVLRTGVGIKSRGVQTTNQSRLSCLADGVHLEVSAYEELARHRKYFWMLNMVGMLHGVPKVKQLINRDK